MKLGLYSTARNPTKRIGLVLEQGIADLSSTIGDRSLSMVSLIDRWHEFKQVAESLAAKSGEVVPLSDCMLYAPIDRPGKILAIGLNYLDHIEESGLARPDQQLWFAKASTSVHAPFDPIQIPLASDKVDYEAEMVAVIGKRTKHATEEQAKMAVFGFCAGNDVSVRDWQMHTPQWFLGKSFDTHAPFGPWIVTADEIGDPHRLGIRCFVNGELLQNSNTRHLVFNVYDQIAHLSKAMTLEPGDLIFTGTPGGVGFAKNPQRWLKAGDHVRVELDAVGAIEAVMVPEVR